MENPALKKKRIAISKEKQGNLSLDHVFVLKTEEELKMQRDFEAILKNQFLQNRMKTFDKNDEESGSDCDNNDIIVAYQKTPA